MKKTKSILIIIGSFLLAIFLGVVGVRELIQSKQLIARGKSVTGHVVNGEDDVSGRLHTHTYYLTVNFEPEQGDAVTKKVKVNHTTYDNSNIGGPVKVWYLPDDPTVCAAGEKVETRYGNIVMAVVFVGIGIFLIITFNKPANADEAAEQIAKQTSILTVPRYEYAPANPENFKHLDIEFYDQGRRWLESLGYTFVIDEENITLRNSNGVQSLLRRLISRDRTILATFYHFKRLGKDAKVLDLETWASNGSFVCTSNAASAGKLDYPPQIDAYFFPAETPLDALLQGHEARLNAFYAQNPGVSAYALGGIDDMRRMGDEMQRIKSEFRSGRGISREELERIAGKSSPVIDDVHQALQARQAAKRPDDAGH
jgi:hypothetical protein